VDFSVNFRKDGRKFAPGNLPTRELAAIKKLNA
jgi:hypothetical protein